MIFRKQPLIDANWLLGPSEKEPVRSRSSLQAWMWTFAGAAAIAGAWLVASDFTIRKEQLVAGLSNRDMVSKSIDASQETQVDFNKASNSTAITSTLDESLIRTVDRFVPKTQLKHNQISAAPHINLEGSPTTDSNKLAFDFSKFEANVSTPIICLDFQDLIVEAKPEIPYELLSDLYASGMKSPEVASNNNAPSVSSSRLSAPITPRSSSRQPQSTTPKVVRTVSYKSNQPNSSSNGTNQVEPQPVNTLRSAEPTRVQEQAPSQAILNQFK